MNKSCEYCQYNGPYLSIINPCENCPNNDFMINDTFPIVQPLRETTDHITNKTYITSTTGCRTNSNGAKINDVFATDLTTDLPTADEYRKSIGVPYDYQYEWSEPKYLCPKCGGGMLLPNVQNVVMSKKKYGLVSFQMFHHVLPEMWHW